MKISLPLKLAMLALLVCGAVPGAWADVGNHTETHAQRVGGVKVPGKVAMQHVEEAPAPAMQDMWIMDTPLPQDALLKPDLKMLVDKRDDIQLAMVVVQMGSREENPRWMMSQTQLQVFLNKLGTLPDKPMPEDDIWPKLKAPDSHYKGITVTLQTEMGKRFAPVKIFEGRITDPNNTLLSPDYGRDLEYWLFGTARVRRDQLLGVSVLPVLSFEQCRLLGQKIVETSPRQCLLPDNNLLLETSELPTLKSARVRDFDQCLKEGTALIYTFPRRCVSAGGRVFTEPPRVYDEVVPADAPLAVTPPAPVTKVDVKASAAGLRALVLKSLTTPTVVVTPTLGVSAVVPVAVSPAIVMPVSGTQAMSEYELQQIEPAAGPKKQGPSLFQRWVQQTWKPEWAEFGN